MDPRVRNQVGLELIEIHIESSVKPEAGRDGGDDLGYEAVEVGVGWSFHAQIILTQIINCLKYSIQDNLVEPSLVLLGYPLGTHSRSVLE